jgi:hypothetical protein
MQIRGGVLFKHSCYRKNFFKTLSIEEQRCWYQKNLQCALIPLKLSPWQKILALQNEQAYIAMKGFDCKSFDKILEKLAPMYSGHMPFNKSGMIVEFEYTWGQKGEVQPKDWLRLVIVWTHTSGSFNVLQLVFGLTYSNLSVSLRFGMCLIVKTFQHSPLARVSIPSVENIKSFKAAFSEQHPIWPIAGIWWMA